MGSGVNKLYEFGGFRFDGERQRLWRKNEPVLLSPKAAELLNCLLEKNGEFVSKEEIFDSVWADTFVEDGVLTQNIYTLRKALGADADGLPVIENKTRLGYRIAVPVRKIENPDGEGAETGAASVPPKHPGENVETAGVKAPPAETAGAGPPARSRKTLFALAAGVAVLLIFFAAGFFGLRSFRPRVAAFFRKPIETVRFQSLTNTGDVGHPALSPDGNFAAYVKEKRIHLKDIASNKEIRLDIPNVPDFTLLQFSPDGNFIYFRPTATLRKDAGVFRVSRFGGEVRLVAEKTWGGFDVSNDGRHIVFVRNFADRTEQILTVKNIETGEERSLDSVAFPEMYLFNSAQAWSPDDKKIAVIVQNFAGRRNFLYLIDAAGGGGRREEVRIPQLRQFEQIAWRPDGESLVVSASEGSKFFHIWKIFPSDGDAQRLTNGLETYTKISLSSDGKKLLAMQSAPESNLFISKAENLLEQKQITFGKSHIVGIEETLAWAGEDRLIYVSHTEENLMANLWEINLSNNLPQQLTTGTAYHSEFPTVSADGKFVYFTTAQNQFVNVWRIDADSGGNLTQITDGRDGFRMSPQISPDGKYLYYIFRNREGGSIRRLDLAERREETLLARGAANPVAGLSLAPDGSRLIFLNWTNKVGEDDDSANFQLGLVSTSNPEEMKFFDVKIRSRNVQITPDGTAFDYVSYGEGKTMILRQNIEGGPPREIFSLPGTLIFNFAWSKSGNQLAVSQGRRNNDAVLLTNFE